MLQIIWTAILHTTRIYFEVKIETFVTPVLRRRYFNWTSENFKGYWRWILVQNSGYNFLMIIEVTGHGRLITPTSRASIWREVYNNPAICIDNRLFGARRSVKTKLFFKCTCYQQRICISLFVWSLRICKEQ